MRCFTGMRRSIPLLKSSLKRSLSILITTTTGEFKQKQNGCLLQNFGKHPWWKTNCSVQITVSRKLGTYHFSEARFWYAAFWPIRASPTKTPIATRNILGQFRRSGRGILKGAAFRQRPLSRLLLNVLAGTRTLPPEEPEPKASGKLNMTQKLTSIRRAFL